MFSQCGHSQDNVVSHKIDLENWQKKLWRIACDLPNSPKFFAAKVFLRTVVGTYVLSNATSNRIIATLQLRCNFMLASSVLLSMSA